MKNTRVGWIMIAIGIGLCLFAWIAFAFVAHIYTIDIGERLFRL